MTQDFEKLGAFYLGRLFDPGKGAPTDDPLLYDSRDLTTHAVCVGMTGSGKTGLSIALLEEAAIDGIPAIAIDPKGDLGDLLLSFPELRPEDFRPWLDEAEARRKGLTPDALAAATARAWREGLAEWGQDGGRIARFRSSVDACIYTPGSSAGMPLTVLRSFSAPPREFRDDADAFRERIAATASGLLALLGIEADPIRSREHILLATLLDRAWREGRDQEISTLIREIQSPPLDRVGALDLESFYPARARLELSTSLNNLLASPSFGAWLEGEPLDVARLLWTPEGRPRLSIVSIAHLSDAERMFFVTLLLSEVVAWMRTQPGTPSLRALLYMDEVFGYFPPVAAPPSKAPMLTLLKQARAFGLGVMLSTQNPVDLDYKGLSNAGTWFLGRLQTERDKDRVLEGLEGASAAAGARFDRQRTDAVLSGLRSRVFLMNNVHEDVPVLFQSRWALSYLAGPLTRTQIQTLAAARGAGRTRDAQPPPRARRLPPGSRPAPAAERPVVPAQAGEGFVRGKGAAPEGASLLYRPALLGAARLHYVSAKVGVDTWEEILALAPLGEKLLGDPWDAAEFLQDPLALDAQPVQAAAFAALPAAAGQAASYAAWSKSLALFLYRSRTLSLFACPALKETSTAGETEGEFRVRASQRGREERDARIEALRGRYAPKLASLEAQIRRAEERVARERSQYEQQNLQTAISVGATVLGALFGRKVASAGGLGRATTAARGMGRSMREKEDIGRAEESTGLLKERLAALEEELRAEIAKIQEGTEPGGLAIERTEIRPRKSDITVTRVSLVWTPWRVSEGGADEPA